MAYSSGNLANEKRKKYKIGQMVFGSKDTPITQLNKPNA